MGFWIGRAISPLHTGLHAPFPLPPLRTQRSKLLVMKNKTPRSVFASLGILPPLEAGMFHLACSPWSSCPGRQRRLWAEHDASWLACLPAANCSLRRRPTSPTQFLLPTSAGLRGPGHYTTNQGPSTQQAPAATACLPACDCANVTGQRRQVGRRVQRHRTRCNALRGMMMRLPAPNRTSHCGSIHQRQGRPESALRCWVCHARL